VYLKSVGSAKPLKPDVVGMLRTDRCERLLTMLRQKLQLKPGDSLVRAHAYPAAPVCLSIRVCRCVCASMCAAVSLWVGLEEAGGGSRQASTLSLFLLLSVWGPALCVWLIGKLASLSFACGSLSL
jgi:hypothetical protein